MRRFFPQLVVHCCDCDTDSSLGVKWVAQVAIAAKANPYLSITKHGNENAHNKARHDSAGMNPPNPC